MAAACFTATWRDWKGDLVPSARRAFGKRIPIPIPPELADEAALLAYLKVSAAELKKIWCVFRLAKVALTQFWW